MNSVLNALFLKDYFLDASNYEEGAHAWYAHIGEGIGIKVGKPSEDVRQRILREFIILKGIELSGITPVAYCHGIVGLKHPKTGKKISTPYILMQHLNGVSAEDILDLIINNFYANSKDYDKEASVYERRGWAFNSEYFAAHREQYYRIIKLFKSAYGLSMGDHEDNLSNFIVSSNGLWHVIDFSCENIPQINRQALLNTAEPYIHITTIPLWAQPILMTAGFLTK